MQRASYSWIARRGYVEQRLLIFQGRIGLPSWLHVRFFYLNAIIYYAQIPQCASHVPGCIPYRTVALVMYFNVAGGDPRRNLDFRNILRSLQVSNIRQFRGF